MARTFDFSPLFTAWAWTNLFTVVCLDLMAFSSCMLTACVMYFVPGISCPASECQDGMASGCGWLHRRHVRLHQSP